MLETAEAGASVPSLPEVPFAGKGEGGGGAIHDEAEGEELDDDEPGKIDPSSPPPPSPLTLVRVRLHPVLQDAGDEEYVIVQPEADDDGETHDEGKPGQGARLSKETSREAGGEGGEEL